MKIYKSEQGLELIIPLFIVLGGVLVIISINEPNCIGSIVLIPVIFFVIHGFATTYYIVDDETLTIKSGLFYKLKINIQSIKKVSETYSILSSPATSFRRLEILYDKFDTVEISPKDKIGFIKELTDVNPSIEVSLKK